MKHCNILVDRMFLHFCLYYLKFYSRLIVVFFKFIQENYPCNTIELSTYYPYKTTPPQYELFSNWFILFLCCRHKRASVFFLVIHVYITCVEVYKSKLERIQYSVNVCDKKY